MIKVTGQMKDGRPMLLLGVTGETIARLMADEPVRVDTTDLGLDPMEIVIFYGKTEEEIAKALRPLIGPGTQVRHE